MAVLGTGGRLLLKRDAPAPLLLSSDLLDADLNVLNSIGSDYWTGDRVTTNCLPVLNGGFPPNPDGWASYFGSKWYLGPNRTQVDDNRDDFYKKGGEEYPDGQADDLAQFYCREGDVSGGNKILPCQINDYWIYIDPLGRVSFYEDRCSATLGCTDQRVKLESVDGSIGIAPYGSLEYVNAIWQCLDGVGEYRFSDGRDSVTLESICEDPPLYQKPIANTLEYDNANLLPRGQTQGKAEPFWNVMCECREWSLDLQAPEVDITSVAEKWGNSVKSLVRGGGSTEFFIDRGCNEEGQFNGTTLMKLLLLTEKGCKAEAQFWMISREGDCNSPPCNGLVRGDLYYEADILVTANAINVRPTEMVAGTAQFVTTGEIRLVESI